MLVSFKVLKAVLILIMFFWVKSPRGQIGTSRRFGEACCVHHLNLCLLIAVLEINVSHFNTFN
jgi:hypothetical protein